MSVKYGILTLLYIEKNHGYELKLAIEPLLNTEGRINAGQIYTTLDRLMRDELVVPIGTDELERKIYEITPAGREELTNWLLQPVSSLSAKESFHFKWSCARKMGFAQEATMLKQQKAIILKDVMALTRIKTESLMEGDEHRYLVASGTLLHLEADLSWIQQIENRSRHSL